MPNVVGKYAEINWSKICGQDYQLHLNINYMAVKLLLCYKKMHCVAYSDKSAEYSLDCCIFKWNWHICSEGSVLTILMKYSYETPVHLKVVGWRLIMIFHSKSICGFRCPVYQKFATGELQQALSWVILKIRLNSFIVGHVNYGNL